MGSATPSECSLAHTLGCMSTAVCGPVHAASGKQKAISLSVVAFRRLFLIEDTDLCPPVEEFQNPFTKRGLVDSGLRTTMLGLY